MSTTCTSGISNALPGLEPTIFRPKAKQAVTVPPTPSYPKPFGFFSIFPMTKIELNPRMYAFFKLEIEDV